MVEDLRNEVRLKRSSLSHHRESGEECTFCKFVEKQMNEIGLDEADEGFYLDHLRTVHGLTV